MSSQDVWAELEELIARVLGEHLDDQGALSGQALQWTPASLADEIVSRFDVQSRTPRARPWWRRGKK